MKINENDDNNVDDSKEKENRRIKLIKISR